MEHPTLEERVAALEKEVSRLRFEQAQARGAVSGRTAPDFLDRFGGIFADDPALDRITQRIEERRRQEREEAEREE